MKVLTAIMAIFAALFIYVLVVDYWQLCRGTESKVKILATYTNDSLGIFTNGYTIIEYSYGNKRKVQGILGKAGEEVILKDNP